IKRWTASGMSFMFVLIPLVASVLGIFILDERVTAPAAAGGLVVLLGVYVGALSGRAGAQLRGSQPEQVTDVVDK
ncbi:MAG TPA: hypothetical protein VHI31_07305, partial [Actinomycetota bacterium]|nr:hypothetical protein [Actinomycetota bacterium]